MLGCQIMSTKWMIKSIENNKFQNFDFSPLAIFEGLEIALMGFSIEEVEEFVNFKI